jgi:hypothetical protein
MSGKRHESVMSSVMNWKNLPMRLNGYHRKLVCEAMRVLDLNDLTWYDFSRREGGGSSEHGLFLWLPHANMACARAASSMEGGEAY